MDRIMLKSKAKEQIKGKIGILFIISLMIIGISWITSLILGLIPGIGALIYAAFISPALTLSMVKIYLNVAAGKTPAAGDVFDGFYDFWSAFKVEFLSSLFAFLWSFLFIIPGIVKAYSYSMAMYIIAENKDMPALEAIRKSKEMMECRKMDLFVLHLSFLGWALLTAFTFGIAGIWAIPYMETTVVNFYNDIKVSVLDSNSPAEPVTPQIEEKPEPQGPEVE